MKLKFLVILLVVINICLKEALSSKLKQSVLTRETSSCESRQTPGAICETCELLATCIKHSSGWVNIPVETCDINNGFYCHARLGICSNMTGPCHPFGYEGNFPCSSHGVFPDPYDCQKYHMCYFVGATLVSATVNCGNDKAYDAATGQCTLSLDHESCLHKQFHCSKAGDARPWPNNPNIFYVCKATSGQSERLLYPTLYRCDDGDVFDGYFCLSAISSSSTTKSQTMPTINMTTEYMQNVTTEFNGNDNKNNSKEQCKEIGLFADMENCRKYFYCSAVNGVLKHMDCPLGSYYNAAISSCSMGSC